MRLRPTVEHWIALGLILFGLAVYWPGITTIPAIDRDEARYAVASRQMAASGDYVDIRFQDETRYKKPVGIYWLQSASVKLLGEDAANPIWPYRLPSLLGMLAAILATWRLAAEFMDRRRASLAAALFAVSLLANVEARLATVDACLCAASTVALVGLGRIWRASNTTSLPHRGRGQGEGAGGVLHGQRASPHPHLPAETPVDPGSGPGQALSLDEGEVTVSQPLTRCARWPDCLLFWIALGCGILLKGPVLPALMGLTCIILSLQRRGAGWIWASRPIPGLAILLAMVSPWLVLITLKSGGAFWRESLGHDFAGKLVQGQESHGGFPGLYLLEFPLAFFPGSLLALGGIRFAWATRCQADTLFLLAWIVPGWLMFEAVPTKLPHYVLPLFPAIAVMIARAGLPSIRIMAWGAGACLALYATLFGLVLPHLQAPFIGRTLVRHRAAYAEDLRYGPVAFAGVHEPSLVLWFGTDTKLATPQEAAQDLQVNTVKLAYVRAADVPDFLKSGAARQIDDVAGFDLAHGKPVELLVFAR